MPDHQVHHWIEKTRHFLRLDKIPATPRKIIVSIIGGLLLIAGLVMIITPGPAFVFIPLGLFFLASEFRWAEEWSQKVIDLLHRARDKWRKKHSAQK